MYSCLFRSWNVQLEPIDYTSRCFSWEFSCKYIWVQAAFLPPSELEDTRPTWQRASWLAFGKKTSSSSSTIWFWFWEFLQPSFWVFKLEDPSKNLWFPSFFHQHDQWTNWTNALECLGPWITWGSPRGSPIGNPVAPEVQELRALVQAPTVLWWDDLWWRWRKLGKWNQLKYGFAEWFLKFVVMNNID